MKKHSFELRLLIFIFPLLFTVLWLIHNNQLPANDAANYLLTATDIHHHFVKSFWNGVTSCYLERGWRPIFFPVLSVPFLLIAHGNLFVAFYAVSILCLLASLIYLYLFFRLELDPFSAIIATNLMGLLPLLQAQILMFYAEAALLPCMIGSIYHLIKSNYLRETKHIFGFIILTALAVMLRPVEAVTQLLLPFILFTYLGWKNKSFSLKEIAILLFIALCAASLFFAFAIIPYLHIASLDEKMAHYLFFSFKASVILAGSIGLLLLPAIVYRIKFHSYLIPTFILIVIFILVWYLPFANETFQWIFRTSFGDVASSTGSLQGSRFSWDVLHIYLRSEGIVVLVGIALLALSSTISHKLKIMTLPILYLLCIIPFPFWEVFYTVQVVTRKLSIAFPALLMALLFVGLRRGKGWKFRIVSASVLLIIQFFLMVHLIFTNSYQNSTPFLKNTIGYFIPQSIHVEPNPHQVVMDFLTESAKKYHLHSIGLEVDPGTSDARHFVLAEPVDPFLLVTLLAAANSGFDAGYPYFSDYSHKHVSDLSQHYDAVFLSDNVNDMQMSKAAAKTYFKKYSLESSASLKTFYELLFYYAQNNLASIGLKQGPCIIVKSVRAGNYRACILLRYVRSQF